MFFVCDKTWPSFVFFQQDAHGLVFTRKVWSGLQISSRRYKVSSAFTAWSISTVIELFSCKSMPCCIAFGQKIHATRLCFLERTCDGSLAEHSGGDTWSRNGCLEKCNASVNKNGTKQQFFQVTMDLSADTRERRKFWRIA